MLCHLRSFSSEAWLCTGDFNEIVEASEKWAECRKLRGQMEEFMTSLETCQLEDLGFVGPKFTWCNKRDGGQVIMEHLDRALANNRWQELFTFRQVEIFASCTLDHAPVFIWFHNKRRSRDKRCSRFQYEVTWKQKEIKEVIQKVLKVKEGTTRVWRQVLGKLKKSKNSYLQWRRINRDPTEKDIQKTLGKVKNLQAVEGQWNTGEIKELQTKAQDLMERVGLKWRQRAKHGWCMGTRTPCIFTQVPLNVNAQTRFLILWTRLESCKTCQQ